jgi:hypothetical protein
MTSYLPIPSALRRAGWAPFCAVALLACANEGPEQTSSDVAAPGRLDEGSETAAADLAGAPSGAVANGEGAALGGKWTSLGEFNVCRMPPACAASVVEGGACDLNNKRTCHIALDEGHGLCGHIEILGCR